MFGEDPKKLQPDAFFRLFTDFLDAFNSARKENISMRQKKADEERRRKKEQEVIPPLDEGNPLLTFPLNLVTS